MKTPYQKYQQRHVWLQRAFGFGLGLIAAAVILGAMQ